MSRKMTSKCDGCGVEIVEMDDLTPMGVMSARHRRGSEKWGSLHVSTGHFPVTFDLCDGCTARVVDLLELEIPKPETMVQRLGGHAMYVPPGEFFGPGDRMAPPWAPPPKPYDGRLTPEELQQLGIELPPSLTQSPLTPPVSRSCANCGVVPFNGIVQGPCPTCGHHND